MVKPDASLLSWNPPRPTRHKDAEQLCPPLELPLLAWYDQHLDESLVLKKIVHLPSSFLADLARIAHDVLQPIMTDEVSLEDPNQCMEQIFSRDRYAEKRRTDMIDAITVAKYYQESTSFCLPIASTCLYSRKVKEWINFLAFQDTNPRNPEYLAVQEYFALQVSSSGCLPEEALSDPQKAELAHILKHNPCLALWQFLPFCTKSENLINDMGSFERSRQFHHQTGQIHSVGQFTSNQSAPPDASFANILLGDGSGSCHTRQTVRLESPQKLPVIILKTEGRLSPTDRLIQRAWSHAVENDCTFLIFNCGSVEHIGIRHRASQTLYLSQPFDVSNVKEPGYAAIQIGLYIAIMKDAKERTKEKVGQDLPNTSSQKQLEPSTGKMMRSSTSQIIAGTAPRHLLLLRFELGIFNSRSPTAMRRVGAALPSDCTLSIAYPPLNNTEYQPYEYFSLVVTSFLGDGLAGAVYHAELEAMRKDSSILTFDTALKFAFRAKDKRRLRHEYSIYAHLYKAGVTGVATILGLFEDIDGGPLFLLMNYAGHPISGLANAFELDQFRKTVVAIHRAGIIHNDIRPQNLLVGGNGSATIIDFHRAIFAKDIPEHALKTKVEAKHIEDLLAVPDTCNWSPLPSPKGSRPSTPVDEDTETNDDP